MQRARLALRNQRDAGEPGLLRHHGSLPGAHSFDQLGARTSDEDYGAVLKSLKKRPYDYFKDFYADTAVEGARAATVCGVDFFGADHVLFASDCPFDKEKGPGYIRDTIKVINPIALSETDREKIC